MIRIDLLGASLRPSTTCRFWCVSANQGLQLHTPRRSWNKDVDLERREVTLSSLDSIDSHQSLCLMVKHIHQCISRIEPCGKWLLFSIRHWRVSGTFLIFNESGFLMSPATSCHKQKSCPIVFKDLDSLSSAHLQLVFMSMLFTKHPSGSQTRPRHRRSICRHRLANLPEPYNLRPRCSKQWIRFVENRCFDLIRLVDDFFLFFL